MIGVILSVATILRLINLDQSLWLDEATQAILSSNSIQSIIFGRMGDFHPPLSYIIYHYWMMFGSSEVWLRSLSVIFGVATVWLIYKIVKKIYSENIALTASLLFAFAPYHIYYSQEIRMYSMATFFATLSILFLINLEKRISRFGYIISTLALIYTFYLGFFLLLSQLAFVFLLKKNHLKLFVESLGLILFLYIPWLPFFWIQLKNGVNANQYLPGWGDLLSLSPISAIPLTFIKFSLGRISFDDKFLYGILALIIFIFFGFLIFQSIKKDPKIKLFVIWLTIPVILALSISFVIPLNQPFRLLFVLPAFYIILAVGIWQLGEKKKYVLIAALLPSLFGLAVYFTNPKFEREDWRGATYFLNSRKDANYKVLFVWPEPFPPYIWYGGKNGIGLVKKFPASVVEINQSLDNLQNNQVYLFEYLQGLSDRQKNTQRALIKNGYKLLQVYNFNGVGFVDLYQR